MNTDLSCLAPDHLAFPDQALVKHEIECIGNPNRTFDGQSGTRVGNVTNEAIYGRAPPGEGNLPSLEHATARCHSFFFGHTSAPPSPSKSNYST